MRCCKRSPSRLLGWIWVLVSSSEWRTPWYHHCYSAARIACVAIPIRIADDVTTGIDPVVVTSDDQRSPGGDLPNDERRNSSLLEKYLYRETVRREIEEEHLPELPEFLESIGLQHRLQDFYRKSVFETKYLFTLNDMDLRLMDLSPDEVKAVQASVATLRVEREVTEERMHPLLVRRNELTYGRLFVDRSASSYEFYLAGFGPPAPVDKAPLVWAKPRNACQTSIDSKLAGAIVLAERGTCNFVVKANNVARSNASALVVINNGDDGEELFRVAATLGGRSVGEPEPKGPQGMATVMVRGSTLPSLSKALEWGPTTATLVPLECKPGKAACEAVLPEEREADKQVDSGIIIVISKEAAGLPNRESETFEFLSATFGATLPLGLTRVVLSVPRNACSRLSKETRRAIDDSLSVGGATVLVRRGGCSFGDKAKNIQDAGGRVMVVQDNSLGVLQNVGAPDLLAKELYIPGVFITDRAGERLVSAAATGANETRERSFNNNHPARLTIEYEPDNNVARAWGSLGVTQWPAKNLLAARVLARQLKAKHVGSRCRLLWIEDKAREVERGLLQYSTDDDDGSYFSLATQVATGKTVVVDRQASKSVAEQDWGGLDGAATEL
ncbi:unnamed protein product [Ascophyllum nodosum]